MTPLAMVLALVMQQPGTPVSLDSGVVLEAALDSQPRIVRYARLNYPIELLRNGEQARVIVQFILDTTGRAEQQSIRVIKTDHIGFNLSAKEFVQAIGFTPPRLQGRKVRALMQMPVDFRIASAPR
jgi:TonB family protein